MDNQPNLGGMGQSIGGSQAIAQAMARRGMDTSILNQLSPASANFQPMPQPTAGMGNAVPPMAQGQPAPQGQPMPQDQMPQGMPGQSMPQGMPMTPPPAPGMNPNENQDQVILQALIERLGHNAKVQKALLK